MPSYLKPCNIKSLGENVFSLLDDDWMLITAGKKKSFNTMTASWGGFGILQNLPVAFIFIRPQRYTLGFVKNEEHFTLSFFGENFKDILNFCGTKSGKTVDKIAETGLIPAETEIGNIFFEQANLVFECRKMYSDEIKSNNFFNRILEKKIYKAKDYHHFFIGEIINCMKR